MQRGARNREAIIDALLTLYDGGVVRPTAAEVAERAGVSVRSVHNHFSDMEALATEVSTRQIRRYGHLMSAPDARGGLDERVAALVERRGELFDAVAPVRRAALTWVDTSPAIARNLTRLAAVLREQVEEIFAPELATAGGAGARADLLDAADLLTSWEAWDRLRTQQGASAARARRVLSATLLALLATPRQPPSAP